MKKLIPVQQIALTIIKDYMFEFKIPPSYLDISKIMSYSDAISAYQHLQILEGKGHIKIYSGKNRGIVIVDQTICAYCRRSGKKTIRGGNFRDEFTFLIHAYRLENGSNIAEFLNDCLKAFDKARAEAS